VSEPKHPRPGTILRTTLRVRNISDKEFAKFLHIEESSIRAILEGERDIDVSLSAAISKALSDPAPLRWHKIQEDHDKWKKSVGLDLVEPPVQAGVREKETPLIP
jgi:plasmid maintenance system antidote protein VapI